MTRETYLIYGSLESAYKHIQKKCAAPWNFRVKSMEIGESYILGKPEYWIKVIYEYDDEEEAE